ncbi:MAG: YecA family protein [Burkholderiaceae bacterium]|nr:YecA family protein [Burkholderiaceae bacterium]
MNTPQRTPPSTPPLDEHDIDALQALLDRVPAPLEALDVSMLDGFLCGVLLQPQPIAQAQWLPHVTDADGRALPASFDARPLHALVLRRHAELNDAITNRQWFDPWVFELEADEDDADSQDDDLPHETDAVYPWVAGFATAQEFFPGLMRLDAKALTAPLALLYRHLEADDLEDADELIEEIESLEPPADLSAAVEELVRATLLLADISRPRPDAARSNRAPSRGPARRPQRR